MIQTSHHGAVVCCERVTELNCSRLSRRLWFMVELLSKSAWLYREKENILKAPQWWNAKTGYREPTLQVEPHEEFLCCPNVLSGF